MLNSHLQLLKDIQTKLAEIQTSLIHEDYYRYAHDVEKLMVRIGSVILSETDKQRTCTCSLSDDQLELPLDYSQKEESGK